MMYDVYYSLINAINAVPIHHYTKEEKQRLKFGYEVIVHKRHQRNRSHTHTHTHTHMYGAMNVSFIPPAAPFCAVCHSRTVTQNNNNNNKNNNNNNNNNNKPMCGHKASKRSSKRRYRDRSAMQPLRRPYNIQMSIIVDPRTVHSATTAHTHTHTHTHKHTHTHTKTNEKIDVTYAINTSHTPRTHTHTQVDTKMNVISAKTGVTPHVSTAAKPAPAAAIVVSASVTPSLNPTRERLIATTNTEESDSTVHVSYNPLDTSASHTVQSAQVDTKMHVTSAKPAPAAAIVASGSVMY